MGPITHRPLATSSGQPRALFALRSAIDILGADIWTQILGHLVVPHPEPEGALVWARIQTDLAVCMRVCASMNTLAAPILYRRCYPQDIVAFAHGVHSARQNPQAFDKKTCLRFIRNLHLPSSPYLQPLKSVEHGRADAATEDAVYSAINAAAGAIYDLVRIGLTVKDRMTLDAFETYDYIPQEVLADRDDEERLLLAFDDLARGARPGEYCCRMWPATARRWRLEPRTHHLLSTAGSYSSQGFRGPVTLVCGNFEAQDALCDRLAWYRFPDAPVAGTFVPFRPYDFADNAHVKEQTLSYWDAIGRQITSWNAYAQRKKSVSTMRLDSEWRSCKACGRGQGLCPAPRYLSTADLISMRIDMALEFSKELDAQ